MTSLCVCPGDSVEFLSWFLNALHACLGGSKKSRQTVVSRTFRGNMRIYSRKVPPIDMVQTHVLMYCTQRMICTHCDVNFTCQRLWHWNCSTVLRLITFVTWVELSHPVQGHNCHPYRSCSVGGLQTQGPKQVAPKHFLLHRTVLCFWCFMALHCLKNLSAQIPFC